MKALYVVSTEFYSGKSAICLGLATKLAEKKLKIGYMKPVGTLPLKVGGVTTDEDANYIKKTLNLKESLSAITPVMLTPQFVHRHLRKETPDARSKIKRAFEKISQGKDIVLLEGAGDIKEGSFINLSASEVAEVLDVGVLLIVKYGSQLVVDDILNAKDQLKEKLKGVIFNSVPKGDIKRVNNLITPYLKKETVNIFGVIPEDKTLLSVTVRELAEHLEGKVLCAKDKQSELVETFMVGAMGQELALRFFRRKANKAVITGGDRPDVQLAALETPTKCLILTGNFHPSPIVLARAEELGVPMIVVDMDTFNAVERTEELVGRVSIHETKKIEKIKYLLENHVALRKIYREIGMRS